ncbi:DUF4384 domain-containing protein [Planktothrix pseudagardhii]|uniref:DUF4384 domain-containing protein n=1 Tax=Planktothrix pseudagardhii TaxID=132604 RepID=A0A9W4G7G0_9CYAN|nr:DUF4384 domain-containing protein [Planktothrix pseudagardhii]CAD5952420.1 hypothetical protein NO713_02662 [Planktothrix pseudagardhii]
MLSTQYQDNEKQFLEEIAQEWGFKDRCKLVFIERFLRSNDDLENNALADVLQENLSLDKSIESQEEYVKRIFTDYLSKTIFPKMQRKGCDFNGAHKDKCPIAKQWLEEIVYPQWLKQTLWKQLKTKTTAKNKMGVVLAGDVGNLGMRHKTPYLDKVPKDSDILFKVNLDQPGHLILLEREPSGGMCCICPSEYAPEFQVKGGEITLPQYPPSPYPAFTATEEGQEQILAVITPDKPSLDWLEKSQQEGLELDHQHLDELLTYVENCSTSQVFYTEYQVV